MDFKKLNEELLNELDQFATDQPEYSSRLTQQAGRKYAYQGPAVTRVTRQDKRSLLKEKDPNAIKSAIENAFTIILAAVSGTSLQSTAVSKVNQMRTQLFKQLDKMIADEKKDAKK